MSRYSHLLDTPEALVRLLEQRDREDTLRFGLRWDRDPDGTRADEEARRAGEVALLTVQPDLAFGAASGNLALAAGGPSASLGGTGKRASQSKTQAALSPIGIAGHLLIEGDNRDALEALEALEALRRTHQGRIRAVLIDPPTTRATGTSSTRTGSWTRMTGGSTPGG